MKRRHFLALCGLLCIPAFARSPNLISRVIYSSGEKIPAIGMGTWLTFDVEDDEVERKQRVAVLKTFFQNGGSLIDSSPMYGSSQEVIGYCLSKLTTDYKLFSATKVWTIGRASGRRQIQTAESLWRVPKFDLMQVHNLLQWQVHLQTLQALKKQGRIRYIGITTSHGRRHAELQKIMRNEKIDFVQFTYNILDTEAERYLLPLAKERGIAVIVNRPFQGGSLFSHVANQKLPSMAKDIQCENWAQFFLKFIISHPAVTCAIPATSRVDHMLENMGALSGPLPNARQRQTMHKIVSSF